VRFLLSGGALPVAVVGLLVAVWVCVAVAARDGGRRRRWQRVAQGRWLVAFAGVAWLTLGLANPGGGGLNLTPFATIRQQLATLSPWLALFNVVGNLAVLVPFGVLARPAFGWSWATTVVTGFAFCTVIEVLQGLLGRSADVDDVILNTAGAAWGAAVSWMIAAVVLRWQRRGAGPVGEAA